MKKVIYLLISTFLLVSCGSLSEAGKVLRNEKKTTTDEFLVKKKAQYLKSSENKIISLICLITIIRLEVRKN